MNARACFAEQSLNGFATRPIFAHDNGSRDCFDSESMSDGHRIAVEVAVKIIHNRINEITGERVEVNVEKWIGTRSNFVITDIRTTHPLRIAAEPVRKTSPDDAIKK